MWNLEGKKVTGTYLQEFPVTGQVSLSRVAYGGEVHHYVVLDTPIEVYGRLADTVILRHGEIAELKDKNN